MLIDFATFIAIYDAIDLDGGYMDSGKPEIVPSGNGQPGYMDMTIPPAMSEAHGEPITFTAKARSRDEWLRWMDPHPDMYGDKLPD